MSRERREAAAWFAAYLARYNDPDAPLDAPPYEAAQAALEALRGPDRDAVERAWLRAPYVRLETRAAPEGNRVYAAVNTCVACGSDTPVGHFCHRCGAALDVCGVEITWRRWKEARE